MYLLQKPLSFQRCVRAQYAFRSDGRISVYNTGTEANGDPTEICGWAYQYDPYRPAALKVRSVSRDSRARSCNPD